VAVLLAGGLTVWAVSRGGNPAAPAAHAAPLSPTPSGAACVWTPYHPVGVAEVRDVGTPPAIVPRTGTAIMTISTNLGLIRIRMDPARTPCAVADFAYLASRQFFDKSSCHRLVDSPDIGLLQCGDPSGSGTGGPTYQFADENLDALPVRTVPAPAYTAEIVSPYGGDDDLMRSLFPSGSIELEPPPLPAQKLTTYARGVVAMANSGADTNGSQFFLVYRTGDLSPDYEEFGTVLEGLDILMQVGAGGDDGAYGDVGGGHPNVRITFNTLTVQYS
jgi:peptidyl-prolyl cis-trans isomerase B (cyclophilin B)